MRVRRVEWLAAAGIAALLGCDPDNDFRSSTPLGRPAMIAGGEGPPSNATAVLKSASVIEVRWLDNSSKETSYRVERSTSGGPFSLRASVAANGTFYSDAGLAVGVQYCYRVAAVAKSGTSAFSNTACATTPAPPRAPANAAATPQGASVELRWTDNSDNEDGFRLERAAGPAGPWSSAAETPRNGTVLTDAARTPETLVCYRVTAFNSSGVSAPSNAACTTPLAAPQGLSAAGLDASTIRLTWADASAVESGYEVQRSMDQSGPFAAVLAAPANVTGALDTGLSANVVYWYRVRAVKDGGFSDFSNVAFASVIIVPAAPTDLSASLIGSAEIFLAWTDGSANEDGFRVEAAASASGPWDVFWIAPANSTWFERSGVPADQRSCYRVFAFNARGDSAPSNIACGATTAPPTALTATAVGQQAVDLSWKDNSNIEDGYEVSRSLAAMEAWTVVATLAANATAYRDASVSPDTSYDYTVRARSGPILSAASNVARAAAASRAPEAPTVFVRPYRSTVVEVNCSRPPGTDAHRLERSTDGGATWVTVPLPVGPPDCWDMLDAGRAPEVRVCYRAFAINSIGESPPSEVACTILVAAPTNFTVTALDNVGNVLLSWTDSSNIETGYVVSRMMPYQDDWWLVVTLPPNTTSMYDQHSWDWNSDYAIYQIVTTFEGGESDPVGTWAYIPVLPSTPNFVLATAISSTQIRVDWWDLEPGTQHTVRIDRCTGIACPDEAFVPVAEVSSSPQSYTDSGRQPATSYTYRVRFANVLGISGPTAASATTPSSG